MSQVTGLRDFLLLGKVVDLAVAIMLGLALQALVKALVADLITPLIGIAIGGVDFSRLQFTIRGSVFAYGDFCNALLAFVMMCIVVYYLIVVPLGSLHKKYYPAKFPLKKCPFCLNMIANGALKCGFCRTDQDMPEGKATV